MIIKSSLPCPSHSSITRDPANKEIIIIQSNLPMLEEEIRAAARMFTEKFGVAIHEKRSRYWMHSIPRARSRKS